MNCTLYGFLQLNTVLDNSRLLYSSTVLGLLFFAYPVLFSYDM